jgi:hypothetical protein
MSEPYWVLSDSVLRTALTQAAEGMSLDFVLMELYVNSETNPIAGDDE